MLIDDLRQMIGADVTDTLVFLYGGQKIWIPAIKSNVYSPTRDRLIRALGASAVKLLSQYYGGAYMQVPTGRRTKPINAQRAVARMQREGNSINEMAKAVNRSRRTIFRWLNLPASEVR